MGAHLTIERVVHAVEGLCGQEGVRSVEWMCHPGECSERRTHCVTLPYSLFLCCNVVDEFNRSKERQHELKLLCAPQLKAALLKVHFDSG